VVEQIPLIIRLGGRDGVFRIAAHVVDNHYANPMISPRYQDSTMTRAELVAATGELLCSRLTGTPTDEPRSLAEVHIGRNIGEQEFESVVDDMMLAMDAEGVGGREQGEVLQVLWDMELDVVPL
jgi:hemoglobin